MCGTSFFRSLNLAVSYTGEIDRIERWKLVELGMDSPVCTAQQEGEHDATIVPFSYGSDLTVDGRPTYIYANVVAKFSKSLKKHADIGLKAGATWNYARNRGKGTIFDLAHPFSTDMNVRPRNFAAFRQSASFISLWKTTTFYVFGGFVIKTMPGSAR